MSISSVTSSKISCSVMRKTIVRNNRQQVNEISTHDDSFWKETTLDVRCIISTKLQWIGAESQTISSVTTGTIVFPHCNQLSSDALVQRLTLRVQHIECTQSLWSDKQWQQ